MADDPLLDINSELENILGDASPLRADFRSLGTQGLRNAGGIINESTLKGMTGRRKAAIFQEMGENDPSLGIIEFMMRNMIRGVSWFVREPSDDPRDLEAADFIRTCMHDMDLPWDDNIDEHLSMVRYGFSLHEICLKRRAGRSEVPWLRSKYQDGRIGWRGMPIRSQDTIERWVFDESGALTGVVQMDPIAGTTVEIPYHKFLLFRTRIYKNNPEGESAFLRAYRPWYFKRTIEESEAMGIQRDLAGIPMMELPPEVMSSKATPGNKKLFNSLREIVTRTQNDELAGIMMPLVYDKNGNKMFQFSLIGSPGSRQFDTSKIIERLDTTIFRTALADFLTLGQGQTGGSGSYALHVDKSEIFLMSLKAYLSQIKNVYNLHAIPRLLELNGMEITDYPQIEHTPLEKVDMKALSESISALAMAGMPIFPNDDVQRRIMEILGLPTPTDSDRLTRQRENIPARTHDPQAELEEIHPDTPPPKPTNQTLPNQQRRPVFQERALQKKAKRGANK